MSVKGQIEKKKKEYVDEWGEDPKELHLHPKTLAALVRELFGCEGWVDAKEADPIVFTGTSEGRR